MIHEARRVVTGHDASGKSVVVSDSAVEAFEVPPTTFAARIWATDEFPSDNADGRDGTELIETFASSNGSAFYIVDWAPNSEFAMHRTCTIDYAAIISGELELVLDSGETTILRPGDTLVQRGVAHIWRNSTDEWCRTVIMMLAAKPLVVDGRQLEPTLK
ncbi:cupin domain-containing protein [Rhodococcus jostii]|uniref:Cupin domain-containing protein n=1 Tax=Rhodococcus jostii TaxID=132919 RepID=A0A1H5EY10_RHOJO|nr:cupin domain-containing protein [Rhodococcus jostii]SED96021.1 Cupin domain-containing protein [Rhodococcus jostii]